MIAASSPAREPIARRRRTRRPARASRGRRRGRGRRLERRRRAAGGRDSSGRLLAGRDGLAGGDAGLVGATRRRSGPRRPRPTSRSRSRRESRPRPAVLLGRRAPPRASSMVDPVDLGQPVARGGLDVVARPAGWRARRGTRCWAASLAARTERGSAVAAAASALPSARRRRAGPRAAPRRPRPRPPGPASRPRSARRRRGAGRRTAVVGRCDAGPSSGATARRRRRRPRSASAAAAVCRLVVAAGRRRGGRLAAPRRLPRRPVGASPRRPIAAAVARSAVAIGSGSRDDRRSPTGARLAGDGHRRRPPGPPRSSAGTAGAGPARRRMERAFGPGRSRPPSRHPARRRITGATGSAALGPAASVELVVGRHVAVHASAGRRGRRGPGPRSAVLGVRRAWSTRRGIEFGATVTRTSRRAGGRDRRTSTSAAPHGDAEHQPERQEGELARGHAPLSSSAGSQTGLATGRPFRAAVSCAVRRGQPGRIRATARARVLCAAHDRGW